ncbi:MAG: PorP/SprF family type IX secretion system membrane protein [Bacteroidales bacterium]|nr:PorP/SprF family type IX secretion system membrane protein [Bacteroidales bacterium]
MNKRINILFVISILMLFSCVCFTAQAQQEPHFTQYMFNRLSYNPAYAGSNGAVCFTGFFRNQWMGLSLTDASGKSTGASSGETMNVSFDMPVNFLHGGIGATVISDKIGYWDNIYAKFDYAFRIQLPTGNLAIGLEGQMFNASLDKTKLHGSDEIGEDDKPKPTLDPVIQSLGEDDMLFDLGLGVYYQVPGKVYLGAAMSKLLQTKSDKLKWQDRRFYYVIAGYEWAVPDFPSWRILPSALLKTDFQSSSSYQLDASVLIEYEHKFWGGLSYRIDDAIMLLTGFSYKDFKIGLSYDVPTSRVSTQASGSLEVFVRYCFRIDPSPNPPTRYNNTIKM